MNMVIETAEPVAEKVVAKRGVGTAAVEAIKDGKTNEETLAMVKVEFPEAKTTLASINWYRNKLRTDGDKTVPTARDLKSAAKAAAAAAEAEAAPAADADPLA